MTADGAPATTTYVEPEPGDGPRLSHFPVTFFAVGMGLAGLSLAWTRAGTVLGAPAVIGTALFWFALVVYVAILAAYATKVVRHRDAVRAELHHPVRLAFVPTITIALVLVATAGQDAAPGLARALWWVGATGQLLATLYVLSAWLTRSTFGMGHVTPAWFIPVVGMVAVPLAGAAYGPLEISWFFFSVGVVFWAALLPLVLTRLFLHDQPVPARLLPTLAVLIAPPSVAFLAYLRLVPDGFGAFTRVLYYAAVFFGLLFLTQLGRLRRLPFFLSWWAYSFPLAALTVATIVMGREVGGAFYPGLGWGLLALTSTLMVVLTTRTSLAMLRGDICVPE